MERKMHTPERIKVDMNQEKFTEIKLNTGLKIKILAKYNPDCSANKS